MRNIFRNKRLSHGVSLVELMAVVGISATLAAIGIPRLATSIESMKLTSFASRLMVEMIAARAEAIKRNSRVAMCRSQEGEVCASSGGWEQGWIVFHDANNNGSREAGEALIHREPPLSSRIRVTGNQNVARYVSFGPTGEARLVSGAFQAGTITLCSEVYGNISTRQVVLNAVGKPRIHSGAPGHCL